MKLTDRFTVMEMPFGTERPSTFDIDSIKIDIFLVLHTDTRWHLFSLSRFFSDWIHLRFESYSIDTRSNISGSDTCIVFL